MDKKVPIGISLKKELVERIDANKGDLSRSLYIQRMILKALGDESDRGSQVGSPARSPQKRRR